MEEARIIDEENIKRRVRMEEEERAKIRAELTKNTGFY